MAVQGDRQRGHAWLLCSQISALEEMAVGLCSVIPATWTWPEKGFQLVDEAQQSGILIPKSCPALLPQRNTVLSSAWSLPLVKAGCFPASVDFL